MSDDNTIVAVTPTILAPTDTRSTVRPYWMQGKIQCGGSPWASLGLDWCPRCQSEEDHDTDAAERDGTYVYRRRCCRCGKVNKWGAVNVTLLLREQPMPAKTLIWCHTPGRDRR